MHRRYRSDDSGLNRRLTHGTAVAVLKRREWSLFLRVRRVFCLIFRSMCSVSTARGGCSCNITRTATTTVVMAVLHCGRNLGDEKGRQQQAVEELLHQRHKVGRRQVWEVADALQFKRESSPDSNFIVEHHCTLHGDANAAEMQMQVGPIM